MDTTTFDIPPPPPPLAERIASLAVGESYWTDAHTVNSIRSTTTRIKKAHHGRNYRVSSTMGGARIWRVA